MDELIVSEETAKRLLARAIELEAYRGAAYSVAELRAVAAEAGVSTAAFDRALQEFQAQEVAHSSSWSQALVGSSAAGVAIGGVAGLVEVTTYFTFSPIAMGVALLACGALGISEHFRSPLRGLWRYGVRTSIVWLGYASTWAIAAASAGGAGPINTMVMFRTTAVGVAITAIFGFALAAFHATRKRPAGEANFELRIPIKRRIADKLKQWIESWARRVDVTSAPADNPVRA